MKPKPEKRDHYHVFLASPGDVDPERHAVRKFFEDYNATTAHLFNAHFVVIDWHNHSSIGVGRPQELITRQTLEKHKDSLALVIGINAQRFGTPSGEADSGTEEEFNWALDQHEKTGWPEIKWFFRRIDQVVFPPEPEAMQDALNQWTKLQAFKSRIQNLEGHPILAGEYAEPEFQDRLEHDLTLWLNDSARPWAEALKQIGGGDIPPPPLNFDAERYRQALLKRYDQLNFEMLDTTGAYYSSVRLWSVFVPQSVREIHQYNPRLLEIPKEHQKRLLDSGELSEAELELAEQEAEALRMDYFNQPLRPVLDVVDEAQAESADPARRKLVLLGDPGAGKSALIRYLALRWAGAKDPRVRAQAPVPLLIELNAYARWRCEGRKDFIRFLEEAPIWHEWQPGQLTELTQQDSRAVLMLDGLDEIFEHPLREEVINDIQRFSDSHPQLPILVSSRVVGYQPQRLRDAGFRHFMLQDLDEDQINDFLDRWHKQAFDHPEQAEPKRARLAKAVAESQSIAMLAGNPLLLTMMAILNRNQELPRDRVELYEQASRVLLHQWDTERALEAFRGVSDEIGLREKRDILRRIAAHMQASDGGLKGNLIAGDTLTEVIEHYLRDELQMNQARAVSRAVVEQLRQRNFILCFVGADSYSFVHRTFLEYFCAADFVRQFNVTKTLDLNGLKALFLDHAQDDEWREVLRLICGQVDERFVAEIIFELTKDFIPKPGIDQVAFDRLILAVACLSEARSTNGVAEVGAELFSKVLNLFKLLEDPTRTGLFRVFRNIHTLFKVSQELQGRWPGSDPIPTELTLKAMSPWWEPHVAHWLLTVLAERTPIHAMAASSNDEVQEVAVIALVSFWPTEAVLEMLERWVSEISKSGLRRASIRQLAHLRRDAEFKEKLIVWAIEDQDPAVREQSWDSLSSEHWGTEAKKLLRDRAIRDSAASVRARAFAILAGRNSEFGRLVSSRDVDAIAPYLDPFEPVSVDHIQAAVNTAGLSADDIDTAVAELNDHLGWDITKGLRHDPTNV